MENKDRIIRWIRRILGEVSKLENNGGIDLLHACGGECAETSTLLKGAVKIRNDHMHERDINKLFGIFKRQYYNTSRLTKIGNKITLVFEACTCPMVQEGIKNPFLCHCTTGYTQKIFETLFGKPVEVNLELSILGGDEICRQVIDVGK